jgi:hypothetical protein
MAGIPLATAASIRTAQAVPTVSRQGDFLERTLAPPFQPLTSGFPVKVSGPSFANPLLGVTARYRFRGLISSDGDRLHDAGGATDKLVDAKTGRQSLGIETGYVGSYGDHLRFIESARPFRSSHRRRPSDCACFLLTHSCGRLSLLRSPGTTHFRAACACGLRTDLTCWRPTPGATPSMMSPA